MEMISVRSGIESYQGRLADLEEAKAGQVEQIQAVEGELSDLNRQIKEKSEEKESEQNSLAGLRKMLEIKERAYDEASQTEQKCAMERNALEQRSRILTEMEKHLDGFAGSVKAVLENSRRGTLHGILGTVSQLIRVDKKYITAIETALGAAIQDIVTDNNPAQI